MAHIGQQGAGIWAILGGVATVALVGATAERAEAAAMKKLTVRVEGVSGTNGPIPADYAFCVPNAQTHTIPGHNKNPAIAWSKGPTGTQSYAIIVVDPDVPSVFDDADKEGRTIAKSLKRQNFYHLVLVDIPASKRSLPSGADSAGITAKGKPPGPTPNGLRGVNDYTGAMSGDMAGNYGGYDGPCPPWNDSIVHHYHFVVYALDVPSLGLSGNFGGAAAQEAIAKHVLAKGEVVGTYAQNPALIKKRLAMKKSG